MKSLAFFGMLCYYTFAIDFKRCSAFTSASGLRRNAGTMEWGKNRNENRNFRRWRNGDAVRRISFQAERSMAGGC